MLLRRCLTQPSPEERALKAFKVSPKGGDLEGYLFNNIEI
jgi:hypothetical protein